MPPALPLRSDFEAKQLRRLATQCRDAKQSRRLLSIAAVYDGMDRGSAAKIGGMDRQTLRDWVIRFNNQGPAGLVDTKPPGSRRRLNAAQMDELACLVEAGPDPEVHGVVRWRCRDLVNVIHARFGVTYKERAIGNLLKVLNFSHISGRPKHPAQNGRVIDGFKKNFPVTLAAHIAHLPKNKAIELWFQDEARLGQKNGRVRLWAKTGTRPRLPADQRYQNAYLFGAICPKRGIGAALVLPKANTKAMQMHLDEISRNVARKAHAVVIMDRAAWHTTGKLTVP